MLVVAPVAVTVRMWKPRLVDSVVDTVSVEVADAELDERTTLAWLRTGVGSLGAETPATRFTVSVKPLLPVRVIDEVCDGPP